MPNDISPEIWFYQTMPNGFLVSIASLVEKIYEKGMRLFIHGHDEAIIGALDELLWTYNPTGFLPHGLQSSDRSDKQDIILGTNPIMNIDDGPHLGNEFGVYLSITPQAWPNEIGFQRMMFLFDGNDNEHRQWARQAWLSFKQKDFSLQFWKQSESGKWEKQKL